MATPPDELQLVTLEIEHVKRCRSLTIRPNGSGVFVLAGECEQGKSSALDAWMYLIGGATTHPDEVIQRGESEAAVRGHLAPLNAPDERFIVERTWRKEEGTRLTVKTKDGVKVPGGPQEWIEARINRLTFDPLAPLELDRKKLLELAQKATGVDTTALDQQHAALFEKRQKVVAEGKQLRARFDALPVPGADVPAEPVSIDALLDEQAKLQAKKAENEQVRDAARRAKDARESATARLARAKERRDQLWRQLEEAQAAVADVEAQVNLFLKNEESADAAAAGLVDPDVAEMVRRISRAGATNDAVRTRREREAVAAQFEAKRKERDAFDVELAAVEKQKAELVAKAKFPVPGLSFGKDGLLLNGFAFEEAADSDKIRVGTALAFAMNPALKVARIKRGSLLDAKKLALVAEAAKAVGGLVLVEKVVDDVSKADTGPFTILIADGAEYQKSAA